MYTAFKVENENGQWYILDPDGDWLVDVYCAADASILLSHLNR